MTKTPAKTKCRYLAALLAIIACLALFIAARLKTPRAVDCDFVQLAESLAEAGALTDSLPGSDAALKRAFGLLPEDAEEFLYFEPATFMDVDEVLVARVASPEQAAAVRAAAEARIAAQKDNFESYGTDQFSLMQEALVYVNDGYVCYTAGHHAAQAMDIIRAAAER